MKELTIVVDDEMEAVIRQSIDHRKSFRLVDGEVKNSFGEIVKFRSITFHVEGIPETPLQVS